MVRASVIVTVRNEADRVGDLLRSLDGQGAHEVIIVDAESEDGTADVARRAAGDLPLIVIEQQCSRGEGRNIGAREASGDVLAFIDGDCTAAPGWLKALTAPVKAGTSPSIAAGLTTYEGNDAFTDVHRVAIDIDGQDVTWPSCNLAYPATLYRRLGGFDEAFITAEDIDLNMRAVQAGAMITHVPEAKVHASTRASWSGFFRQAYWNGYGRRQLARKHGSLGKHYSVGRTLRQHFRTPTGPLRLAAGVAGYLFAREGDR